MGTFFFKYCFLHDASSVMTARKYKKCVLLMNLYGSEKQVHALYVLPEESPTKQTEY